MAYAIEADDLSRSFGAVQALDGLRLRVRQGSIFGYLGPNGAGKTTTLHLLLGILAPSRGRAVVAGVDVAADPHGVRARCGALLEHNGLYERLTARENLEFFGRVHGIPVPDRRARIQELLEGIGLWERRDDRVATWSRGMKQQLAIARALLHRPQVLFLDEPTAGFDALAAGKLRNDLLGMVKASGVTVFLTTHNLREAEAVCDEVAVIRQGRLLATGPPDHLRPDRRPVIEVAGSGFTRPLMAALGRRRDVAAVELKEGTLRIELKAEGPSAPIVKALVTAGALVEEVRRPRETLEESFVAILEGR
ncbi:MAG: ABC transporter ATP-binding protein [Thermoplasmatota archaeon]|nr:ABC transporter ATP-binding protein [Halobacteriales archaeon]